MRTQTLQNAELFERALGKSFLRVFAVSACALIAALFLALTGPRTVGAATSSSINFQARLETNAGSIVADGDYNVEFKLYDASSSSGSSQGSCTGDVHCLWVETRTGTDKVHVVNGYLTVNLGSVTSFGSLNWNQQLWLTMNIGGTGTPSWDGEMSPRLLLTATPYSFQAGQLATTSGSNIATLSFTTPTAADNIVLPDASGTVCLQSSAACGFATGTGSAFLQGGNSFSGTTAGELGTNNNGVLNFRTNNTDKLQLDTSGNLILQQASTFNIASAATGSALTIRGGDATSATNVGGNLILQGGAGASTGASGSVIVKSNTNNSTAAFQVQDASGSALLTADTSNGAVVVGNTPPASSSLSLLQVGATAISGGSSAGTFIGVNASGTYTGDLVNIQQGSSSIFQILHNTSGINGISLTAGSSGQDPTIAAIKNNTGITINANGSGTIKITPTGTGSVVIGSSFAGSATSTTIGNTTGSAAVNLQAGSGNINLKTTTTIGTASSSNGTLIFNNSAGANTITLQAQASNPTSSATIFLPTAGATGTQCLTSTSGSTSTSTTLQFGSCAAGNTLQSAYNNSAGASPSIDMTSTNAGFTLQNDNTSPITGELFGVHAQVASGLGASLFTVDNNGNTLVKNRAGNNSSAAFQVQNASGNNLLTVDSTNTAIVLGNDGTPAALTVRGGAASGTDVPGANLTFDASNGTGSGGSGDIIFRTASGSGPSVTFDAGTYGGSGTNISTLSWSHTTTTQNNRLLIVDVMDEGATVTSVTYNGVSLTSESSLICNTLTGANCTQMWYLVNPPSGTNTVQVTLSGSQHLVAGAATYYNVNQATPFGTLSSATNPSNASSISTVVTTTSTRQMVVDSVVFWNATITPNAGQTTSWTSNNTASLIGASSRIAATGSAVTVGWSSGGVNDAWAIIAVPINPGAAGSTSADTLTDVLHLANSGFVGIQNSNPQYTLDVTGMGNFATAVQTPLLQSAAGAALTITGNAASTWSTTAGDLTIQGGSGNVSLGTSTVLTASGSYAIQAGTAASTLTVGTSSMTGTLTFGNSTAGQTINIGHATVATAKTQTIRIGDAATGTGKDVITIGNTNGASSLTLQGGTGGVSLDSATGTITIGTSANNKTISIGATGSTANTTTVHIADTTGAVQTVTIGSTSTTSTTTIQGGSGNINLVGNASDLFTSSIGLVQESSTTTTSTNPIWVAAQGKYAYVVEQGGTAKLEIFDVTNVAAPTSVGSLTLNQTSPAQIQVQGKYAYIAEQGSSNGKLEIVDISNPKTPTSVGTLAPAGSGSGPFGLYVSGRYAYIADSAHDNLVIYDVADPTAPAVLSTIATTQTGPASCSGTGSDGQSPRKVYVVGRYAYVVSAGASLGRLTIIDVSNPASPSTVGCLVSPSSVAIFGITVQGGYAYIAQDGSGLRVVNVSNPATPSAVGLINNAGYDYGVVAAGRYLFGSGYTPTNRVMVADISDPTAPSTLQTYTSGISDPRGMFWDGRYLYVANKAAGKLLILDTSGLEVTSATIHSLESGNLAVDTNASIGGDLSLQSGLAVGGNSQLNGNLGVGGSVTVVGSLGLGGTSPAATLDIGSSGTIQGAGLSGDCSSSYSKLLWSSSTKQFSCGTDRASYTAVQASDQTVNNSTTLVASNDLKFTVGTGETWIFEIVAGFTEGTTSAGYQFNITTPASSTCKYGATNYDTGNSDDGYFDCATANPWAGFSNGQFIITGSITTTTSSGTVQFQFAQNTATATNTILKATSSYIVAYKVSGADLAEIYYTKDAMIKPGDVVSLDATTAAGVKKTDTPYQTDTLGIVSTQPGTVLGTTDGTGIPVLLALSGRVPVKVSTINGAIRPGDYLTASSIPGVAMKATQPGQMIGKAMTGYDGSGPDAIGSVIAFTDLTWANPSSSYDPALGAMLQGASTFADLNVAGVTTLNDLVVTGSAEFRGTVTVGGHIITAGVTPLARPLPAAGAGTGGAYDAACSVTGNDTSGSLLLQTGALRVSSGAQCTVTFAQPYDKPPHTVIGAASGEAAAVGAYVATDAKTMTLYFTTTPGPDQIYVFNYWNPQ